MRDPTIDTSAFPMARCAGCGKTVLTYVALDDRGEETRCCVHCDAPVAGALKWVSAGELEAAGYNVGHRPAQDGAGCGACSVRKNG
jgi:hypothetical protein